MATKWLSIGIAAVGAAVLFNHLRQLKEIEPEPKSPPTPKPSVDLKVSQQQQQIEGEIQNTRRLSATFKKQLKNKLALEETRRQQETLRILWQEVNAVAADAALAQEVVQAVSARNNNSTLSGIDHGEPKRSYYEHLRSQARAHDRLAKEAYSQKEWAQKANDQPLVIGFTQRGDWSRHERDRLNEEASALIYHHYNTGRPLNEIDLHGQYIPEAIRKTDHAIAATLACGSNFMTVIVGKGLQSPNNVPKLKPAVEHHLKQLGHMPWSDPRNAGVLHVFLVIP